MPLAAAAAAAAASARARAFGSLLAALLLPS
jgi:hypothetical protein